MAIAWPATLPARVRRPGHSETPRLPRSSFEADAGPPIERRKGTVRMAELDCTMIMTTAQVAIFEAFVFDTLVGGVLPFTFLHPRKQSVVTVRLADVDGEPWSVRPLSGVEWDVSFKLRVVG